MSQYIGDICKDDMVSVRPIHIRDEQLSPGCGRIPER